MAIPVITATPSAAAAAYKNVDTGAATKGSDFGEVLQRAVQGVVDTNKQAETLSTEAIAGGGNLTDVVAAVSRGYLRPAVPAALRKNLWYARKNSNLIS